VCIELLFKIWWPLAAHLRSNTMTFSKWGVTAFAAARPPIPAPMTTARFRIGLAMRLSPDGRDVGRGNPRRSNGQQGERAPLQENFINPAIALHP
jgi:hypothetical protein